MIRYIYILTLFLSMALPCEEGEVELWGLCYSIENTTILSNLSNTSGEIPQELCALVNLEVLNLMVMFGNTNFVSGEIPDCICNLHKLTFLDFGWNELSGEIPDSIGNLSNLTHLSLLSNQLTGKIPYSIGSLTNITYMNLGFNAFSGGIPESIGNLSELTELYFSYNFLSGPIPVTIGNLSDLTMLSIMTNQLSGEIPSTIGNLVNLTSLNAAYNQLEGEIPESIGNLTNLDRLWLNFNNLSGEVPSSICNLNTLNWSPYGFEGEDSYLNNNQLCPPYPECIEDNIGEQDTSECVDPEPEYDIELHIQNFQEDGTFELILVNNTDLVALEFDIPGLSEPNWDFSDNFPTDGWWWMGFWLFINGDNIPLPVGTYFIDASGDMFSNEFCIDGSVFSNSNGEQITNVFFSDCAFVECSNPGDVNYDGAVDILDIIGYVNDILNPWVSNELFHVCGDINSDDAYNILDIVLIVNIILEG